MPGKTEILSSTSCYHFLHVLRARRCQEEKLVLYYDCAITYRDMRPQSRIFVLGSSILLNWSTIKWVVTYTTYVAGLCSDWRDSIAKLKRIIQQFIVRIIEKVTISFLLFSIPGSNDLYAHFVLYLMLFWDIQFMPITICYTMYYYYSC